MTTKKGTKRRRKSDGMRWVGVMGAGAFAITMAGAFAPRTTAAGTAGRAGGRRDHHRSILGVRGGEVTRLVQEVCPGCQKMIFPGPLSASCRDDGCASEVNVSGEPADCGDVPSC